MGEERSMRREGTRGIKKLVYKGTAVEVRCSASVARNFGLSGTSARKLCAERAEVTCN